ncbi:MAG: sensor histidine kinase, partial [Nitriliruptorales bacterium]
YLEDPDPAAADAFEADPGGIADLDLAGMLLAERLARDLAALADWVPAIAEVAAGRETPAGATARLGELAGSDLVLDDATSIEARPGATRQPSRELLRAASSLLAVATTGTQDAGQSRRDALLRERARIGSVIHEGITQVLTNVAIQLEVLDHVLDDPEQARSMIHTSREAVLEALDSLRSIIFDLTPPSEEWSDLVGGLERFVADFSAQWGVSVALDVAGESREVDAEVTSLAFAFVQEGLTNARKHAQTDAATVRLAFTPTRLSVEVVDDGVGIDPQEHEERSLRQHQGLKIMESRVRLMDGAFLLESAPGGGTRLRMEIPA